MTLGSGSHPPPEPFQESERTVATADPYQRHDDLDHENLDGPILHGSLSLGRGKRSLRLAGGDLWLISGLMCVVRIGGRVAGVGGEGPKGLAHEALDDVVVELPQPRSAHVEALLVEDRQVAVDGG